MAIIERIQPVPIEQELKVSYLDYSMSVIVSRALPDVRDGLKPVQRRILYVMHEMGLAHNRPFRKCAAIVGDTLGKYHPHGDSSVYDALVRMAQDWNMRYPLIEGQGNFGSIDGDSAAAYRYTEARLAPIAAEILADIEKNTVDMVENFDQRLLEPKVLPSAIPNLLVNGCAGIAVGFSTNLPPHNIAEICDAVAHYIDHPESTVDDLARFVQGPDFPTGGIICGRDGIRQSYRTGRGRLIVRGRVSIETAEKGGKQSVVITEIPYQVNKSTLIDSIAKLVREKKLDMVADLRDESDKDGMRIVIELKRNEDPKILINQLYKFTELQKSYAVLMLALVNNTPRVLNLRELVHYYVEHRADVVERRTRFDLQKAEERAHIVEGLLKAIEHIDAIIALIRNSKDADEARDRLIAEYGFTIPQANAILAMRLRSLTSLEREELEKEYRELQKEIERLKKILSSRENLLAEVKKEILAVKEKYKDSRRTDIVNHVEDISIEDLIADEMMVVTISNEGYIKRLPVTTYRKQQRGGKGVTGMETKDEDFVKDLFVASALEYILFFTNKGRVYWRKVHELPQAGRTSRGRSIRNLLNLDTGAEENGKGKKNVPEKVTATLNVRNLEDDSMYVFMVTRRGIVKKTNLTAFSNPRSTGIIAIELEEGDELIDVQLTTGKDNVLIATHKGIAIRFPEEDVRPMGRSARGVIGIRLDPDDYVVGMSVARDDTTTVLSVSEYGYGKRTEVGEYRLQHRGGSGIINMKTTERNGNVVAMLTVSDKDDIVVVSTDGNVIRMSVKGIRTIGRNTQGVRIMTPAPGARVSAVAKAVVEDQDETETADEGPTLFTQPPSAGEISKETQEHQEELTLGEPEE
jgi:DNA gyrase subunit A